MDESVNEWVLSVKWVIFQLYHREKRLYDLDEMIMKPYLYKTNILSWIVIVLAYWHKYTVDMSPHTNRFVFWFHKMNTISRICYCARSLKQVHGRHVSPHGQICFCFHKMNTISRICYCARSLKQVHGRHVPSHEQICFLIPQDEQDKLDFYCASSLKQVHGRHVAPHGHIIFQFRGNQVFDFAP